VHAVIKLIVVALAIVPSIIVHEVAHGWIANWCGDPTAKNAGRLSLNPIRHIDPVGTVILPLVMYLTAGISFGYAKPVPVSVNRLRDPRRQSFWVSLAGPVSNFLLLGVAIVLGHSALCEWNYNTYAALSLRNWLAIWVLYLGLVNVTLGIFNLLPIPPLDGSALIERFVPMSKMSSYYHLRARALPFAMVFFIINSLYLHLGSGVLQSIQDAVAHWVSGI
jgi:Zn-dependent protease